MWTNLLEVDWYTYQSTKTCGNWVKLDRYQSLRSDGTGHTRTLWPTFQQLSNETIPGWLGYIGDYTTQVYRDYFINHYKDPYKPTSISWKVVRVFFVAQLFLFMSCHVTIHMHSLSIWLWNLSILVTCHLFLVGFRVERTCAKKTGLLICACQISFRFGQQL